MATASDVLGPDITSTIARPDGRIWLGGYGLGLSVLDNGVWRHRAAIGRLGGGAALGAVLPVSA
jgi:hypothetical protein